MPADRPPPRRVYPSHTSGVTKVPTSRSFTEAAEAAEALQVALESVDVGQAAEGYKAMDERRAAEALLPP